MKNLVKLTGIIVFAAIIGFSMTACGPTEEEVSTDGRLTITGIDDNNVKQISAGGYSAPLELSFRACEKAINLHYLSGDTQCGDFYHGTVTNGQAVLKVFTDGSGGYKGYNGNDQNVEFTVNFYKEDGTELIIQHGNRVKNKVTVNFTNGIGSGVLE